VIEPVELAPPPAPPPPPSFARRLWTGVAKRMGEIAIVTAGILLAFTLDAWWDNRATAEHEQVHLRALVSDMQQNVAALTSLIEMEEKITANSQELLRLSRVQRTNSSPPVMPLVQQVFNSRRYEPVMGAYEALVNSGGLTMIRAEPLRAALAEFAASVRGQYAENWSDQHYFEFAREFGGRMLLLHSQAADRAASEREYERMLSEPKFLEHLAMRYYSERDMNRKYQTLLKQAEELLVQLRAQVRAAD
jgi:hypothetical protein